MKKIKSSIEDTLETGVNKILDLKKGDKLYYISFTSDIPETSIFVHRREGGDLELPNTEELYKKIHGHTTGTPGGGGTHFSHVFDTGNDRYGQTFQPKFKVDSKWQLYLNNETDSKGTVSYEIVYGEK